MVVNNEQIRFQKKGQAEKEPLSSCARLCMRKIASKWRCYLELELTHASDFKIGAGAKQLTVRFDREKWRQIQGHKSAWLRCYLCRWRRT